MIEQMNRWRGLGVAPANDDRFEHVGAPVYGRQRAGRVHWPSVRRVGLRLLTIGVIALLCTLSGTAQPVGAQPDRAPVATPAPWLTLEHGLAPLLAE